MQPRYFPHRAEQIDRAAMVDHHALRLASGSRRVQYIGQVLHLRARCPGSQIRRRVSGALWIGLVQY